MFVTFVPIFYSIFWFTHVFFCSLFYSPCSASKFFSFLFLFNLIFPAVFVLPFYLLSLFCYPCCSFLLFFLFPVLFSPLCFLTSFLFSLVTFFLNLLSFVFFLLFVLFFLILPFILSLFNMFSFWYFYSFEFSIYIFLFSPSFALASIFIIHFLFGKHSVVLPILSYVVYSAPFYYFSVLFLLFLFFFMFHFSLVSILSTSLFSVRSFLFCTTPAIFCSLFSSPFCVLSFALLFWR